jgi:hypothetical protein
LYEWMTSKHRAIVVGRISGVYYSRVRATTQSYLWIP